MEIKCDIEKTKEIMKNIDINVERYNEIVKSFYDIVKNFNAHGWTGTAACNYASYLENKKKDFDVIYTTLHSFDLAIKKNVESLENAIDESKVSGND